MIFRTFKKTPKEPIWLTVLCDMTTNLMLFFLMLYSFTRMTKTQRSQIYTALSSAGKKDEVLKQKADNVIKKFAEEETQDKFENIIKSGDMEKYSNLEVTESQMRLVLNTPVLFDSGRAEVKYEIKAVLKHIASVLSMTNDRIIIEGHTDNLPIKSADFRSNWELSARRAVNVIKYFAELGLPSERFIAAGYGEYFPRFSNDTPSLRAKNRRIEIVLMKEAME